MGRKSHGRRLVVWMNGEKVGIWDVKPGGSTEFSYADTWLDSAQRRPISLSMPLRSTSLPYRGTRVDAFFDNLLPDTKKIRERLRSRFSAKSTGAFDLLEHIGRDCVGAVQLLPDGQLPNDVHKIQGAPLSASKIAQRLDDYLSKTLSFEADDEQDDFRISLAGAQEKTALLKVDGRWMKPIGPTPTTHILKLPIGTGNRGIDLTTSVENEWLCARLLAAFGIEVAKSRILTFGGHTVLEVERFDRQFAKDGSWIMRLPQEDFCQVTGTSGELKYEVDGGPGIAVILKILQASIAADQDRITFLRTQILFWLLCAIDGHAKNFSIFLLSQGRFRLTPSYDVLSAYPVLGGTKNQLAPQKIKMAMAISGKNRHYRWSEIRRPHWVATAQACGMGARVDALMDEIIAEVPLVLEKVSAQLPAGFPANVADTIFKGIKQSTKILKSKS